MAEKTNNKGLSNPAVLAVASSPAGQQAVTKAVDSTLSVAKVTLALAVIGVVGYIAYTQWKKRFVKLGINPNLPIANVSDAQAEAKAEAIYTAMFGLSADVDAVAEQLAGLNYNGWIKVYNAFGKRKGADLIFEEMNLIEWLNNQFKGSDMETLQFILPGVF